MEYVLLYIGTVIMSFGIEIQNEFNQIKDVADAGYKLDFSRLTEIQNQLSSNFSKLKILKMLIPIYNILDVVKSTTIYEKNRPILIEQLKIIDVLQEMSEEEKQMYLKKPTGFNALVITIKSIIKESTKDDLENNIICDENNHFTNNNEDENNKIDFIKDKENIYKYVDQDKIEHENKKTKEDEKHYVDDEQDLLKESSKKLKK